MRSLFLSLFACLLFSKLTHAEVVLSNNTSTTQGNYTLNGANFSIGFTPTSVLNYDKFFLNVNNQFGTSNLTQVKLTINGGSELIWNGTVSTGVASQLIDFDISSLGQSTLSANTLNFAITGITGDVAQTAINHTNNPSQVVTGIWNSGYSNTNFVKFELTAVPEPGTLLLGGIALVCGGGGLWRSRRRRKAAVDELPANQRS